MISLQYLINLTAADLAGFLASPSLKTASVSVHLIALEGSESPASHQADLGLIPASTMKAVTTATALQLLGPDYTFKTSLYLAGDDLVIKGGGDPTLSASSPEAEFLGWLTSLKKAGLTTIKGDLIADGSHFESRTTPDSWPWGDIGNYYGAGPSGLNFYKNTYNLTFKPGRIGSRATLSSTFPTPPGVTFHNQMITGTASSGDQGYVYASPGGKIVTLRGSIPFGGKFTIKGALPDPPLSCAKGFQAFLKKKGITIGGSVRTDQIDLSAAKKIHEQKSPKLAAIIKGTNHRSVNLYADSLFKALSSQGTTAAASTKIKSHWRKQNIDLSGFVCHDGSGLSPRNTITARQLATIVKKAANGKHGNIFTASLPIAGQSGTIQTLGKGTDIAGRIRAKSGSLTRVRTYAGILTQKSGKKFAFAVMTNNTVSSPKKAIVRFLNSCL